MRNEVAVRNSRELQNNQCENYSIQEIAEKIFNARHDDVNLFDTYENDLKNGVELEVKMHGKFRYCVIENASKSKFNVEKGTILGVLSSDYNGAYGGYWPLGEKENIIATVSGKFKYEFSVFDSKGRNGNDFVSDLSKFNEHCVVIGKIFLPEFDFYQNNKIKIDELVKNKENEIEIEEQSKRDEEQRKNEKLLTDQRKSIENLDNLLKDLDKYIEKKELPEIQTLKVINDQLKILYAQKDNLNDVKSIKDNKSHFENAYKEAKKNPELTDIIEQRMLDILKTFYEVLGESKDSINIKISEIKSAGNDKKFAVEFDEKLNTLNESITKLQSSFTNEKKLDFVQLETIEKISVDFEKQKKRINQKKLLERSKDSIESIYIEYIKLETKDGSEEKLLKRILKNFYLIFEKSEQQINESFEKIKENETIKSLSAKIRELETSIENNEPVKIELLQILEDLIKELVKQKDIIQYKTQIENMKVHFDAIFKDFKKRTDFSNSSNLRMQEIEKGFNEVIGKKKTFLARILGK